MDLLIWSHSYSIGNGQVDEQHRKLMALINTLHNIQTGESDGDVGSVVQELIDYTVYHFESEEKLQQESGYPGFPEHKKIHEKLVAEVSEKAALLATGEQTIREELMLFLTNWLKDHILGEDRKFGNYLKSQEDEEEDDL